MSKVERAARAGEVRGHDSNYSTARRERLEGGRIKKEERKVSGHIVW